MSFNIQDFRSQIAKTKATLTPEELSAPDKPKGGKFFNVPGVYEVSSGGYQPFSTKAGGEWYAIPVKADSGQEERIGVNLTKYGTDEPNVFAMQMMLKAFGFTWSQVQIASMWESVVAALPVLTVGRVFITVSYQGFILDYIEKGVFGLRDFGKGAPAYPENLVIDPVNGDKLVFGSREEGEEYAKAHSIKLGKKTLAFLKPSEGMEWTKEQKEVAEAMDVLISDKPVEVVEVKANAKPAWRPGAK